jgi:uncharacterized protein
MMKELVEYIVKQLVEFPDQVEIFSLDTDDRCILKIKVADQDRGKVIGRQGQTIKAIRTLVSASIISDKPINVDINR